MNYLVIPFDGSKLVIDTQTEKIWCYWLLS
jgi:hypothetical protein